MTDVVLFSTADWATRYWTNKQHMATALARRGSRVLYVETTGIRQVRLSDRRDLRRLVRRLVSGLGTFVAGPSPVAANIWRLSPLALPWGRSHAIVRRLNTALLSWSVARFVRRHRFDRPQVWTYHPFMLTAIADLPIGPLIYHNVDDISAVPGVDARAFRSAEIDLLKRSDVVFVTARTLEERSRRDNRNVHFFPNVADAGHFGTAFSATEPADLRDIPHPRLGYHGVLSDTKIDAGLLHTLAIRHPDWHIVLIGDEREGQPPEQFGPLRALPNVHFLGGRDYAQLPAYLGGFDVGLLPLARNAYTASMYPMKLFEYLAAGVPVVSTDLPFVHDAGSAVAIAADADSFIDRVAQQLARGRLSPAEAQAAIGDNTWDRRLDKMLAIVAELGK